MVESNIWVFAEQRQCRLADVGLELLGKALEIATPIGWKVASVLNGAVGATRPPVDEGWAKEGQMIGQSGRTVHPKLYIGVAISGQMHHMVGIRDAETVVAINQDPQAPIFEFCDLGLVGEYKEILPPFIEAVKQYST